MLFGARNQEVTFNEYKISSKDYGQLVLETIKPTIDSASKANEDYINKKYINSINETLLLFDKYIYKYIEIVEEEINRKKKGLINIPTRISQLDQDKLMLKQVNERLEKINV